MLKQDLFKYGGLPSTSKFFGRKQELQQIETIFTKSRRFVITGIDGQGKTNLAIEIGRRSKKKVCFIDYVAGSNINAIDLAVKTLADVMDSYTVAKGVAEATEALNEIPTLLIFDNLENVQSQQLVNLLSVAKQWSETGECRVLITSKTFDYKSYDTEYKKLALTGLIEKDAIEYFQYTWQLAGNLKYPKSSDLLQLFKLINFQPLLIKLLVKLLQKIQPIVLKENLDKLLSEPNQANQLWLILNFMLKNLKIEIQKTGIAYWLAKVSHGNLNTKKLSINSKTLRLLPRLGVFQNGAFEPDFLEITDITRRQWDLLSSVLLDIGLIQFERLPLFRVPYIKFHPILAPILWSHIAKERDKVFSDYQQRYAQLSAYMSYEEGKNTDQVRNLIRRDFPNLIHAVSSALDTKATWAPQFVKNLNLYLTVFGFEQDKELLTKKAEAMPKK
ncbi:MAG: hypothetical protein QM487_13245 [Candidatus Marithrix sp.]